MQETLDHIRKIAFGFFAALGLAHFVAGFLYVNNYGPGATFLINRVLFIPFFVAAYTYALTQTLYTLTGYGKYKQWHLYVGIGIGAVLFIALLATQVLAADRLTPLI